MQVFMNRWIKKIVVNPYNRTLLHNEKEHINDMCNAMNGSNKHFAEQKKVNIKECTQCDPLYVKVQEKESK